jgi:hypothetical protein
MSRSPHRATIQRFARPIEREPHTPSEKLIRTETCSLYGFRKSERPIIADNEKATLSLAAESMSAPTIFAA